MLLLWQKATVGEGWLQCTSQAFLVHGGYYASESHSDQPIGFSWLPLGEFSVELTELHQLSPQVAFMWRVALMVFGTWLLRRSMIPGAGAKLPKRRFWRNHRCFSAE